MTTHGVAPFPLYWPLERPRTKSRQVAKLKLDFTSSRAALLSELNLFGARQVVISSNIPIRRDGLPGVPDREPEDPGVAVYFTHRDRPFVIACDHYSRVRWNVLAVARTIEALRTIERHGSTSMFEQAFSGFAQLPASTASSDWRETLGVSPGPCTRDEVQARYRELARRHHPDVGGTTEEMARVNAAFSLAMRELA